jgi:hypothetical protein
MWVPRGVQVRADVDGQLVAEDVIPNRESLLVFSRRGYIKRMQTDLFAAQVPGLLSCQSLSLNSLPPFSSFCPCCVEV